MDELTPLEMEYWCASERLDPDGGQAELASLVATQIINALMSTAAGIGGGSIEDSDLLDHDAFVPYRKPRDKKASEVEAGLQGLESLRGL
jgi:hypothetical protein